MDVSTAGPRLPSWAFAIIGAVTMLGAGLVLIAADSASANLHILAAAEIMAALPFVTLWFRTGRRRTALLAMWIGAATTLVVGGAFIPGAVAQAAVLLLVPSVALPLLVGALCQALLQEAGSVFHRTNRVR